MKSLLHNLPFSHVIGLARAGLPYITLTKARNLLRVHWDKKNRRLTPKSRPIEAIIDVTTNCNLRCPYCPTGSRRDNGREQQMVDVDTVRKLADEAGEYLLSAVLFNWGEPLLHPQVADIVDIFHSRNVLTMLSSNMSLKNPRSLEDICDAGLDYLIVSISGASQEVYGQYHRTGSLENVWRNVDRCLDRRKSNKSRRPIVEIKYLAFKHNVHELKAARRRAGQHGVDIFRRVDGGGPEEEILRSEPEGGENPQTAPLCDFLWQSVVLTPDNGLSPCCLLYFKEDDFATYNGGLANTMRNDNFLMARRLFNPSSVADLPPEMVHACLKCDMVHKQPHLKDYLQTNPNAKKAHRTGGP